MTEREMVKALLEEFAEYNGLDPDFVSGKEFTYEALKAVFTR